MNLLLAFHDHECSCDRCHRRAIALNPRLMCPDESACVVCEEQTRMLLALAFDDDEAPFDPAEPWMEER